MTRAWIAFAVGVLCASCQDAPRIVQPTPPPVSTVPANITLTATLGLGASAGQVFLVARVFNASGQGAGNVLVQFSTTAGTLYPAAVTADAGGIAQTMLQTTTPASIVARAGSATTSIDVTPNK